VLRPPHGACGLDGLATVRRDAYTGLLRLITDGYGSGGRLAL
jgi:hypothetical protein